MRFSTSAFSVVACAMAGLQAVLGSPVPVESPGPVVPTTEVNSADVFTLGPAPYDELQKEVAEALASGKVKLDKRQICGSMGVYLCEHANFAGACYWGAYPGCTKIVPDTYWQFRISSIGPDVGVECFVYGWAGVMQVFVNPGGNCNSAMNDRVSHFHCNPDV